MQGLPPLRPPQLPGGLPGGYRPISAPGAMHWAAAAAGGQRPRPAALGQLATGQSHVVAAGAVSAPNNLAAHVPQQVQHGISSQGAAPPPTGLAAVGQGQLPVYRPPAGYLQQQHGQLPAPGMPLNRPPVAASSVPMTGALQTQGAWRPSAPFLPPAGGVLQQTGVATPQQGVLLPATASAAHLAGVVPQQPEPQHAQQFEPVQTGMVTFAAEPVKEPSQHQAASAGAAAAVLSAAATGVHVLEPSSAANPGQPQQAAHPSTTPHSGKAAVSDVDGMLCMPSLLVESSAAELLAPTSTVDAT